MQILYGIALAFGGYALFDAVDVKGDLGALIIGAMLASHPLAGDISKRLLGFKDLLLVGFFLSIGMSGNLTVKVTNKQVIKIQNRLNQRPRKLFAYKTSEEIYKAIKMAS